MEVISFHLLRVLTVGKFTDALLLFVKITFSIPRLFSFFLCSCNKKKRKGEQETLYILKKRKRKNDVNEKRE